MLVNLATQVRSQVHQLDQLERQSRESSDFEATYSELVGLRASVDRLIREYKLLTPLLADDVKSRLSAQLTQLERSAHASRQEFAQQHRQVQPIKQMAASVKLIENDLQVNWTAWARSRINPLQSTYALVRLLPEIRQHAQEIAGLHSELLELARSTPNEGKVRNFNAALQRYEELLSSISGFSPKVRLFLQKVLGGTATLADLDDEVLEWCRQPGHGAAFRVSFASPN